METGEFGEMLLHLNDALKHTTHERFSEKIGVGTSTLKRLLAGKKISEKCLTRIAMGVYGKNWKSALKALATQFPEKSSYQKLLAYHESINISEQFDESFLPLWEESDTSFKVMNLLSRKEGVQSSLIERHFGLSGLEFLDRAKDDGKIEEIGQGIFRSYNWRFSGYDGRIGKSFCLSTVQGYKPDTFGTKESALYHTFGRLSEIGFSEGKNLVMKFGTEFQALEEKYPGDIPFSLATVMIKIISDSNPDLN